MSDNDAADLPSHSDSIRIAARPAAVWQLVTAMERYGEWSSENTGGRWRKGADGELGTGNVGDQFVGINRRNGVEWEEIAGRVRSLTFRARKPAAGKTAAEAAAPKAACCGPSCCSN